MFIAPDPALAAAAVATAHHRRGEDDDDDATARGEPAGFGISVRIQSSPTRSPGSDRSGDGEIA